MGGETFDVLVQHAIRRTRLLRTWSASEIEKVTGWLQRMNAKGYDIFIRPAGAHALVLVDNLKRKDLERLTSKALAPAAVIETAPGSHQAWIRLSDQDVSGRLREATGQGLAENVDNDIAGNVDNAGNAGNPFGRLAGFANLNPAHAHDGRHPYVQARECTGALAPGGAAHLEQLERMLDQSDVAREKQARLEAIRAIRPAECEVDASRDYLGRAQELMQRHGEAIDPDAMDRSIALDMMKSGRYARERIAQAIGAGSLNFDSMQNDQVGARARRAVQNGAATLKADKLRQFRQKRDRDLDQELDLDLGR